MSRLNLCLVFILGVSVTRMLAQDHEQSFPQRFSVVISAGTAKTNALVHIPAKDIMSVAKDFNKNGFVVLHGKTEIPSQYNSLDAATPGIVFILPVLQKNEKKILEIRYNPKVNSTRQYEKKTQAELSHKTGGEWKNREYVGGNFRNVNFLRVPPEHKDHSWFIRYEGPGWESDKVAYRFYLDQRNAVDVFGKKTSAPVLQQIGLNGFDSYHEMQPWGMDVLKVGKSLGLGSISSLVNGSAVRVESTDSVHCRILENGPVYSSFETKYAGWKVGVGKQDVIALTSIHSGSRITSQELTLSGKITNISTGIGKDSLAAVMTSVGDKTSFGYIATYGKQSLNGDDLGLVVFFDPANFESFTHDQHSHIVELTPRNQVVKYYFAAAWVLEPDGIKNKAEFEAYISAVAKDLANPIRVQLKK